MKKTKKLFLSLFTLILIPLLFLTSCQDTTESEELRSLTVRMIDAMKAGDPEAAYALALGACTQEEFDEFYEEHKETFLSISTYELYTHSVTTETEKGKTYEVAQFVLLSEEVDLVISTSLAKNGDTIAGLSVGKPDGNAATLLENSGTIFTLGKSDAKQWALLAVSLLTIGYIVWAAIDCARRKIEGKALWLVFILIGIFSLSFTFGNGDFGFAFNISFIFKYTALIGHVKGLLTLRLMIPVGAITYTILRKKLHAPPAPPAAPVYRSYLDEDEREQGTANDTAKTDPTDSAQ